MATISSKLEKLIKNSIIDSDLLKRRIIAELEFAEGLADFEGRKSWRKLIDQAGAIVETAINSNSPQKFKKTIAEAETILQPIGKTCKKYTAHCIGHGHMDMNWMWGWPETVAATNDTITTVLKLMDEFPDFRYSQGQASVYEIIRKYNPELFSQIQRRVAEGRWEVTAAEWVEGDKNLASGESLTRHLLYTRRYMQEHFGLSPEDVRVAWNPDTFGHANTIPMIYTRGGVSRYYMCRGGEDRKPPLFWWEGPDGSRVLVNLEHTWYNDVIGPHNIRGMLSFCRKTGLKDWMNVYGIGDHGGGPTRRDIRLIREMDTWPIYPNFKFATTQDYYSIVEKQAAKLDLPVVKDELNYEFTGCYTSQSDIKKTNRLAEHAIERAEVAASIAHTALGRTYPHETIRDSWIRTIFGHFHDILPGSGVKGTREYHSGLFQETAAAAGMVSTHSLRAFAGAVDTTFAGNQTSPTDSAFAEDVGMGGGVGRCTEMGGVSRAAHVAGSLRPFVIFNPSAWPRQDVLTLTVWDAEHDNVHKSSFIAVASDGREIPVQRIGEGAYWGHNFTELALPVSTPAMGYSTIVIKKNRDIQPPIKNSLMYPEDEKPAMKSGVQNHAVLRNEAGFSGRNWGMENDNIRVFFDRNTGGITELTDKKTGMNFASPENQLAMLEYILEQPGGMTSWVIHPARRRVSPLETASFLPGEMGPHIASYVGKYTVSESTIEVTYTLKADATGLEISIKADWHERGTESTGIPTLRLQVPLTMTNVTGRYETPFGSITRKPMAGQEVPSQRWVDVAGKIGNKSAGLTLLNDCKYGYSLEDTMLRATLIRSSYDPDPLPEHGKYEMKFAVIPHDGKKSAAELIQQGAGFNQPLQVISTDVHTGQFPACGIAGIACEPANVLVTNVKKAEDEDALIFRLLETAGKATQVKVKLDGNVFGKASEAVEVDLVEKPSADSTAKTTPDGFTVKIPANAIASVKIGLHEK